MINRAVLQGRLTRDPELSTTQSGVEKTSFTVAWSEKYKETETKCFLSCIAWRQTGVFVNQYFKKGQEIVVEGKLSTRSYEDKNGNNRTVTELTVDKAHFCGPKEKETYYLRTAGYTPDIEPDTKQEEFQEIPADSDLPF